MNKAMSDLVLKKWYEECKPHLECHTQKRFYVERSIKDKLRAEEGPRGQSQQQGRWAVQPYVLAHEFLYLVCNCQDRLKTIKRLHKPELSSLKGNINHWEIQNRQTGKQQVALAGLIRLDFAHKPTGEDRVRQSVPAAGDGGGLEQGGRGEKHQGRRDQGRAQVLHYEENIQRGQRLGAPYGRQRGGRADALQKQRFRL